MLKKVARKEPYSCNPLLSQEGGSSASLTSSENIWSLTPQMVHSDWLVGASSKKIQNLVTQLAPAFIYYTGICQKKVLSLTLKN
jgi:hypothetical protein